MEASEDLHGTIRVLQAAVKAIPADHPDQTRRLNNLGIGLGDRFRRIGAIEDLEESIRVLRATIDATPTDHPNRASRLNNLGIGLGDRFRRIGAIEDLEESIRVLQAAVEATSADHSYRASFLSNLGNGLGDRFRRTRAIEDLEESIRVYRAAIEATPADHPHRASFLSNLGIGLGDRFSRIGAIEDLEESIRVRRLAIGATLADHPDRVRLLVSLGNGLSVRFSRIGAIEDLEESIRVYQAAIKATPTDHLDQVRFLGNLGNELGNRFSRTGAIEDLEESIRVYRAAIKATPIDYPDRVRFLGNLGIALNNRFSRIGAIEDLEESIRMKRAAIDVTPADHPDRADCLNNLGVGLGNRFLRTGAIGDVEESIHVLRAAIEATPADHPDRERFLGNLGIALNNRFLRTGAIEDLEEGIRVFRVAIKAAPTDNPGRAARLNNLGIGLDHRFSRTGAIEDLEESIQVCRAAIEATPTDHPDRVRFLNNLGNGLGNRFSRTGAIEDLEESISVRRLAIETMPADHPDRAGCLNNLGIELGNRFLTTKAIEDLHEAQSSFLYALQQLNGHLDNRIFAGRCLISLGTRLKDPRKAYEASILTIPLLPKLTPRSLRSSDKQYQLRQIINLASDAAALALETNHGPQEALSFLEQGRGLLAASLEDMRVDLLELRQQQPDLARRFIDLRARLNQPPNLYSNNATSSQSSSYDDTIRLDQVNNDLDKLISEIRRLPDFEDFLGAPSEMRIRDAAKLGPIVVVNVSQYRCDALLATEDGVTYIPLRALSLQDIEEKAEERELGKPEVLQWLWDTVTGPVLEKLGFDQPSCTGLKRIWWIPTGQLSMFPLHAAGYHRASSGQTVLDRVISSYSPSVKQLISSRRRRGSQPSNLSTQALLVDAGDSLKTRPLSFASKELRAVRHACEPHCSILECSTKKESVLSAIKRCHIFHFIGHGQTNPSDPSHSKLLLDDWQTDPLTVADLLDIDIRKHAPFLAYLSACGTSEVQDKRFYDESLHLASACQLAGFRHVIGTLWEVDDAICVRMAEITYERLTEGEMTDQVVSWALHEATRELRNRWIEDSALAERRYRIGQEAASRIAADGHTETNDKTERQPRDVVRCEETPLRWVPYVHFGA